MKYYSTNHHAPLVTLRCAVEHGLAPDKGLYMPERFGRLSLSFFQDIDKLSFQEIAFEVAKCLFQDDIDENSLKSIVYDTLSFDTPLKKVQDNLYSLELFHGPTLAFKDVGARFMARMLQYFIRKDACDKSSQVNVLVATSGDTGSAVANGFLGTENIHVYVLYPKGKVSRIQESQFTTLGHNITALEVNGNFDDCQALVKQAFMDADLKALTLTSANSINVARLLPQSFYYFNAYAQLKRMGIINSKQDSLVFCVPSGNFGNITAGLIAARMGLPVSHFIAANNANDEFYQYLKTGTYTPRPSIATLANAMDVGAPSNFARILDLYNNDNSAINKAISGATYTDEEIRHIMRVCYQTNGYILDPHGACAYQALKSQLQPEQVGVFLETAHPAKFKEKVDAIDSIDIEIPERLQKFMQGKKSTVSMARDYDSFKAFLLSKIPASAR